MQELTNWGNYPRISAEMAYCDKEARLHEVLERGKWIARGLGRSYGDASLGDQVLDMRPMKRMLAFDADTGVLECEAGLSFDAIIETFLPRGFFLPVTPGTRFVTVGGAIAADVHGKNHHVEGSFGQHVLHMDILKGNGDVVRTLPGDDLFRMTVGGMGLSGVILRAAFKLKRVETAYILQQRQRHGSLEAIMDAFEASANATYSVAWIDGIVRGKKLGRSVLFTGEHARRSDLRGSISKEPLKAKAKLTKVMPFYAPSMTLNPLTVRAFNIAYYHGAPATKKTSVVDLETFFYPLDSILHWNRAYGRKGFTQYQFVLPLEASRKGIALILDRIAASGQSSFLSVLKLFGKQDDLLSFPMEGYTLAMDFPIRAGTFELLDELDRMVLDHGGRIYLAKDARMKPRMLAETYDKLERFKELKASFDGGGRFASHQSKRLGVTE